MDHEEMLNGQEKNTPIENKEPEHKTPENKRVEKLIAKGVIRGRLLSDSPLNDEDEEEEIDIVPVTEETSLKGTVTEMVSIIMLWGILVELSGVFFVKDKIAYSIGLVIGLALAIFTAINIARGISKVIDLGQSVAANKIRLQAVLRYLFIVAVFTLILFTKFANPIAAFLGLMGLKVSAYLQPLTHKFFTKYKRRQ